MATKRIERVNALLEKEIGLIIQKELHIAGALVTVTRVETTANLIESRVYISVFPQEFSEDAMEALRNMVHDIQQQVNHRLKMRPVPRIMFISDEKPAEAARIESILRSLN